MKTPDGTPLEPVFDWYQYSSPLGLKDLLEVLEPFTSDNPLVSESPKLKGYGWALKTGGRGGSLLIHYGGKNGDDHGPNVAGTGSFSPKIAELTRAANVPHGVGRADVRLDFLADFAECRLKFIERCNLAGMRSTDTGSCPESTLQLGRTVYGGSKTSFYQPTLYQKGLQLGDGHPVDYLRLEHRFAPSKSLEKSQLSSASPLDMIGLRPVARDLSESIAGLAASAYKLDRQPKELSPYHWMLVQYGKVFRQLLDDHGSPAAAGCQIYHDLAELAEDRTT